jgi:outer membrane protein OmpA-like peptidoglycan-associated protein
VPEGNWEVIAQAQASASYVFCLNQYFCIGPDLGVGADVTTSHNSLHIFLGISANAAMSPSPPKPQELQCAPCKTTEKKCEPQKENTPCPECPKCTDTVRKEVEFVEMPTRIIRFQNDKVDLFPQKFPSKPETYWGRSNQYLDDVIRKVWAWSSTLGSDYTITLKIRGFANETGQSKEHNHDLADARAQVVADYLIRSQSTRDHSGKVIPPLVKEGRLRDNGPTLRIITVPPSHDPKDDILQILNTAQLENNQQNIMKQNVEDPKWRMVLIEYRITKETPSGEIEIPIEKFIKGER